jgi:hypothetical protein
MKDILSMFAVFVIVGTLAGIYDFNFRQNSQLTVSDLVTPPLKCAVRDCERIDAHSHSQYTRLCSAPKWEDCP